MLSRRMNKNTLFSTFQLSDSVRSQSGKIASLWWIQAWICLFRIKKNWKSTTTYDAHSHFLPFEIFLFFFGARFCFFFNILPLFKAIYFVFPFALVHWLPPTNNFSVCDFFFVARQPNILGMKNPNSAAINNKNPS